MKLVYTFIFICLSFSVFSQSTFVNVYEMDNSESSPYITSVIQTSDGGFLVSGYYSLFKRQCYLHKVDKNGDFEWQLIRDFSEGIPVSTDFLYGMVEMDDRYVLLGLVTFLGEGLVPTLIHVSTQTGEIIGEYKLENLQNYRMKGILRTQDNQLAILGYDNFQEHVHYSKLTFLKTTIEGDIQWLHKYEEANTRGVQTQNIDCIIQNESGGFYLSGGGANLQQDQQLGDNHITLIETDATGELQWIYQHKDSYNALSMTTTDDAIYATTKKFQDYEVNMLRLTHNGDFVLFRDYQMYFNNRTKHVFCTTNRQGELFVVGQDTTDLVFLSVDEYGIPFSEKRYLLGDIGGSWEPLQVVLTDDNGFIILCAIYHQDNVVDGSGIMLIRLNADGELGEISHTNHLTLPDFNIQAYPNPITEYLIIENQATDTGGYDVTLCDSKGTIHYQGQLTDTKTQIPMQHLASGAYILSLRNADNQIWSKMVVKK